MKLHKAVKAWIHAFQQEFYYRESCTQLTAGPTEACCIFLRCLSWPTSGRIWEGGFQGYKTQGRAHFYTWSNHNIIRSFNKPHFIHTPQIRSLYLLKRLTTAYTSQPLDHKSIMIQQFSDHLSMVTSSGRDSDTFLDEVWNSPEGQETNAHPRSGYFCPPLWKVSNNLVACLITEIDPQHIPRVLTDEKIFVANVIIHGGGR